MHRFVRLSFLTLLAAALPALAACSSGTLGEGGVTGTGPVTQGGGTGTTGGSSTSSSPVVGRWWQLYVFQSGGAARTSETRWEFSPDGVAVRTLITTNLSDGIADVLVWTGRWKQVGTDVEVSYVTPVQGTVRFAWRIDRDANGDVLWLDNDWFRRSP